MPLFSRSSLNGFSQCFLVLACSNVLLVSFELSWWSYTQLSIFFSINTRSKKSLYYGRVHKCDKKNTLLYICVAMVTMIITPY